MIEQILTRKGVVSISIVTFNSEDVIIKCLEHITNQTYKKIEIIVVDNKSTDHTFAIMQRDFPSVILVENKENTGYCGGHNQGIRTASGEYILCLNPDMFIKERYIESVVGLMNTESYVGGCIGKIYQYVNGEQTKTIDTTGLKILKSRRIVARGHGEIDSSKYGQRDFIFGIDGMVAFYRRTMLEDIRMENDYFDECYFAYCEDQDVAWRAQLRGWKFVYNPEATGYHVRKWKHSPMQNFKSLKSRDKISGYLRKIALRNHYITIIKNDFVSSVLLDLRHLLWRFLLVIGYGLLFERDTLKGLLEIFKCWPQTAKKRHGILSGRRVSKKYMRSWFGE